MHMSFSNRTLIYLHLQGRWKHWLHNSPSIIFCTCCALQQCGKDSFSQPKMTKCKEERKTETCLKNWYQENTLLLIHGYICILHPKIIG